MARKVLLDCDTGIDDAVAIAYAAAHPGIDLRAVGACWGNVDVGRAAANSLHVLEVAGAADVPVAVGARGPLDGRHPGFVPEVHGDTGRGRLPAATPEGRAVSVPAALQLIEVARAHPGEVTLVAVAPLTNVALALALEPTLPQLLAGVTVMGGAVTAPGNVTAAAESNAVRDPVAAQAVLSADWPVTLVPLDVTMTTLLEADDLAALGRGGPLARYLGTILEGYAGFYAAQVFGALRTPVHDVLALAVGAGTWPVRDALHAEVTVDTGDGPGRGQTLADLRGRYRTGPSADGEARDTAGGQGVRIVQEVADGFAGHLREVLGAG